MKILTGIITIFLIFGILGVPSSVFAQETSSTGSDSTLQCNAPTFLGNSLTPLLKGGGGGRGGGGRSSSRGWRYGGSSGIGGNSTSSSNSGILNIIAILMGLAIIAPFIWWKIKK